MNAHTSFKGAGWCYCEANFNYVRKIMVIKGASLGLEEIKSRIFKKEDFENYRVVSLTSVPGKTVLHTIPEAISRHFKYKVIWKKQNEFP